MLRRNWREVDWLGEALWIIAVAALLTVLVWVAGAG